MNLWHIYDKKINRFMNHHFKKNKKMFTVWYKM